jgi:hypothetical protein
MSTSRATKQTERHDSAPRPLGPITITAEMRGGLSGAEIDRLPQATREALLNGVAARVGLISLAGEETAEAIWRERTADLQRRIAADDLPKAGDGSLIAVPLSTPDGFHPGIWDIHGKRFQFVGQVARLAEAAGMALYEEPQDEVVYVSVVIDPSWEEGTATGWITGHELKQHRVR